MKTMHLFAGCGGGLLSDLILGHEPICAVEWWGPGAEVLRKAVKGGWFPSLCVWEGDVRLFDASPYEGKVDCIAAGFPCQPHSTAGRQLAENDERDMWPATLTIIGKVRPKLIFLENVSGIVSNGYAAIVAGDLAKSGYNCIWLPLSASNIGADHERERWWCLAYLECERQQGQGECFKPIHPKANPYREASGLVDAVQARDLPYVCRRHDGVSYGMDAITMLGNAQSPIQAATAFSILWQMMEAANKG